MLHDDIFHILIDESAIQTRVGELAAQINADYAGKELIAVCILKGSVVFFSDLVRHLDMPVRFDFMSLSSYGDSRVSSGIVRLSMDLCENIEDKHVLIIEDIVDTGLTLQHMRELLHSRSPKSLKFCTFLDKAGSRIAPIQPDYCGFAIEDYFVVGYGLDCSGMHRNLPYIAVMK